jgi:hypothetical protein
VWIAIRLGKTPSAEENNGDSKSAGPSIKVEEAKYGKSDRELVHTYLSSLNRWLETQKDQKASRLYKKCPQKSLSDVERALQGILKSHLDSVNTANRKVRLFQAAKSIFQLFLPLQQRNPMCSKLWGALHGAITVGASTGPCQLN